MACTCVRGGDVAALSVSESTLSLGPVSTQDAAALPRQEAEVGRRFSGLLRVFGSDKRFRWSKRAMRVWAECGADKSGSTKYELKKSLVKSLVKFQVAINSKSTGSGLQHKKIGWFPTWFSNVVVSMDTFSWNCDQFGRMTKFFGRVTKLRIATSRSDWYLVKFPVAIKAQGSGLRTTYFRSLLRLILAVSPTRVFSRVATTRVKCHLWHVSLLHTHVKPRMRRNKLRNAGTSESELNETFSNFITAHRTPRGILRKPWRPHGA